MIGASLSDQLVQAVLLIFPTVARSRQLFALALSFLLFPGSVFAIEPTWLTKLDADVVKAQAQKKTNPSAYEQALTGAAQGYQRSNKASQADAYFQQALSFYNSLGNSAGKVSPFELMGYVLAYEQSGQYLKTFAELEASAERNYSGQSPPLDTGLRQAIDQITYRRNFQHQTDQSEKKEDRAKKAWKTILDNRTSIKGPDDHALVGPLCEYAAYCARDGDLATAEDALLHSSKLSRQNKIEQTLSELHLADFYVRHQMYSKFRTTWQRALANQPAEFTEGEAKDCAALVSTCLKENRINDAQALIEAMLLKGGDWVVRTVDPSVQALTEVYTKAGDRKRAEYLVLKRLEASKTCSDDYAYEDWRVRLSNIYLRAGRTAESEKLFQEITSVRALNHMSNDSVLTERAALLKELGMDSQAAKIQPPIRPILPIHIHFCLFAGQELNLGHNTDISAYDSSPPNQTARTANTNVPDQPYLCSLGVMHMDNLNFYLQTYARPDPTLPNATPLPIPAGLTSISPALPPPTANVTDLRKQHTSATTLKPGDYIVDDLNIVGAGLHEKGRYRFFLVDGSSSGDYEVNMLRGPSSEHPPADFQIWYSGSRRITAEWVVGVIYAPNAIVDIPFNGEFTGAIAANRIIGEGNNRYKFDRRLYDVEFK